MSQVQDKFTKKSAQTSKEQSRFGLIGHVINYHPESLKCHPGCSEHDMSDTLDETERHSADIKVLLGKQDQVLKRVPCMVYSQGVVSNGLRKNDRVWVQFINGDTNLPVITGYYRDPSQWELLSNTFKYSVANVFAEMIGVSNND